MLAALVVVGFLMVGATLSWIAWAGSQRRLSPPAAWSSESNWYAGHEAAAGPLGLAGGVALTCGVGVATVGFDVVGQVLASVGLLLAVVCVAVALVGAKRSASAAPQD